MSSRDNLTPEQRFVFDYVDRNAKAIALTGDNIFYFAELGMQEFETAGLMTGLLEKGGFKVERGISGFPTGFCATYGSGGPGSFHHLNSELFSSMTGIKMTHVPYKGSVPAMTDLVSGQIDILFTDIGPSIQLIRAGKARALGITSAEFAEAAPEIPPIAKALPGFDTTAWQMMVAPGGTPRPVLEKLNSEINALVQTEDIKKRFVPMGIVPIGKGSLTDLEAYVKLETTRWAAVIKNAGLAGSQ